MSYPRTRPAFAVGVAAPVTTVLDVVVPVHNEQVGLGPCVRRLHAHFPYPFRITVADNASVRPGCPANWPASPRSGRSAPWRTCCCSWPLGARSARSRRTCWHLAGVPPTALAG